MPLNGNDIPRVYIASRFANKELVQRVSVLLSLAKQPWWAIQTWTNEDENTLASAAAARDLMEIDASDIVLVLTENCERVPGGMHFETGYAYGRGKRVVVVGARCHVFHSLPNIEWYPTLKDFFATFAWSEVLHLPEIEVWL